MTKYHDKWRKGMKKGKNGKYYYPAKRAKGQVKKAVRKVQQKTELKDRVAHPSSHDLATVTGSAENGPSGSYVMVPESMFTSMTQGNLNGQFEGNEITPKFLNFKLKLNFEHLSPFGGSTGTAIQSYYITVTQGWVKISLKDAGNLSQIHSNASSGRKQPAFVESADPHALALNVARQALFNANFQKDFLSYEKRSYNDVKVLRRFRVFGDQRKKFVTPAGVNSTQTTVAPDKHYVFNWRMTNKKQEMAPITGATTTYGHAESWIPFVMVTLDSDEELHGGSKVVIENANHYTYSDL